MIITGIQPEGEQKIVTFKIQSFEIYFSLLNPNLIHQGQFRKLALPLDGMRFK